MNRIIAKNVAIKFDKNKDKSLISFHKSYNNFILFRKKKEFWALSNVSFTVKDGEILGVIGNNGSGKSTLIRLLLGLYAPRGGSILIDGVQIEQYDPVDLRRNMGYVAQDVRLFQGSLRDNVTLGAPLADDAAVIAAARLAGLDRLVDQHPLGFELTVSERGEGLSGGQRQAVAVARAVLMEPRVLLLDEPTSAMDFNTEQTLIRNLAAFARGRTLVLVTHRPSMLQLADRLIVLDAGRVVADGPREQVLTALSRPLDQGVAPVREAAGGGHS